MMRGGTNHKGAIEQLVSDKGTVRGIKNRVRTSIFKQDYQQVKNPTGGAMVSHACSNG